MERGMVCPLDSKFLLTHYSNRKQVKCGFKKTKPKYSQQLTPKERRKYEYPLFEAEIKTVILALWIRLNMTIFLTI